MAKPPGKTGGTPRVAPRKHAPKVAAKAARATPKTRTIAAILKEAMPGWELAQGTVALPSLSRVTDMKSEPGPSIEQLRRKFFPQDAGHNVPTFGDVDKNRRTVRIRPKDGGPAKTADIDVNTGQVSIVQG